ncbi:hypothetical protein Tco_0809898 [Tanacetum coccineum]
MNFSKISKPLTSLTQKDQKYEWDVEQEEAFQILNDNLCKVIAYASRQLKIHEKNYTTHNLEREQWYLHLRLGDCWELNVFILSTAKSRVSTAQNGNSFKPAAKTTTNVDGTSTTLIPSPVTTEEKVQKKNDMKARSMLLMALPDEHLITFNQYKYAKTLFTVIQTRFGGNEATKKTQKTLSKQISLPSERNTHVVVWRNKPDLDTMSFDDLYNIFKIVEQELVLLTLKFSPASTQVSTASTQVSTANLSDDTVYVFLASQPNGSQLVYEDLEQIHEDDIEEMDLKWQLALLSMRTRRFFQKTGRKITINGSDQLDITSQRNMNQDISRKTVNVEETSSKAMLAIDGASFNWSYMADDEVPTNMVLMAFSDSEFQQSEFEGYGPKTSKNVSEDTSNEVRNFSLIVPQWFEKYSEDSTVTYTAVSSPFRGLSDIGSPRVDGPPVMPKDPNAYVVAVFQASSSPDYVLGPEYPPLPDFVPDPVYPKFMPPEDESDPEEDPKEDDEEDPEEDPADYPADGGYDGDDEDELSDDDEDDDVDIEGDEEEEHPAPANSTAVALPAVDQAPSAEETEPFETDESAAIPPPHPAYHVTARMLIRDEPPTPFWYEAEIPSPPLPVSPLPLPVSPTYLLGYRTVIIRLRAEAPSTSHSPLPHIILSHTRADTPPLGTLPPGTPPLLPIPLPTSSPPLHLLATDRRADRPEVTLPPRKRLGITLGLRYKVGESSPALTARPPGGFRAYYGFVVTMDREIIWDLEREVSYGITDTWDEMLDTHDIYVRLDDEQTERQVMAGRLNTLYRDRRAYARTEVMSLRTAVLGQQAVIIKLQAADRKRQAAITELLAADHMRQAQFIKALKLLKALQT